MLSTPIFKYFNEKLPITIKYDSSDYVAAGILSQPNKEKNLYPIVYFSRKLLLAELNYNIYNKELLAIIRLFKEQKPKVYSSSAIIGMLATVLTNYQNLEYFIVNQKLSRQQIRQSEYLTRFYFMIKHVNGDKQRADALIRMLRSIPQDYNDDESAEN